MSPIYPDRHMIFDRLWTGIVEKIERSHTRIVSKCNKKEHR
jgi:hypothetical protein